MWVDRAGPPISKPIRTAVPDISRNRSKSTESRLLGAILEVLMTPRLWQLGRPDQQNSGHTCLFKVLTHIERRI
ncbi:13424_t:CDS:2 [Acaulospora colombiana]|uniref:13424_t:CDS:1 n=1 Tax=Acaulospora colombiana TaxID=27376 RepID=A0ACA9MBX7_9GLOM|nr:13424_t:CDS:2 [Acaulospora colombiana]